MTSILMSEKNNNIPHGNEFFPRKKKHYSYFIDDKQQHRAKKRTIKRERVIKSVSERENTKIFVKLIIFFYAHFCIYLSAANFSFSISN